MPKDTVGWQLDSRKELCTWMLTVHSWCVWWIMCSCCLLPQGSTKKDWQRIPKSPSRWSGMWEKKHKRDSEIDLQVERQSEKATSRGIRCQLSWSKEHQWYYPAATFSNSCIATWSPIMLVRSLGHACHTNLEACQYDPFFCAFAAAQHT